MSQLSLLDWIELLGKISQMAALGIQRQLLPYQNELRVLASHNLWPQSLQPGNIALLNCQRQRFAWRDQGQDCC
ncbi:hypothetical protein ACL9RI_27685, partial [Janthinobacterium sp. Mn2066]|uniref:hypothetical protein n=1 Tax=Janthinobacterium sp. Mn2066 TaxID=3395264 RepID=UPI003BCC775D